MTLNEKYAKKYRQLIEQLETEGETTTKRYKDKLLWLIAAALSDLSKSTSGWIEDCAEDTYKQAVAGTAQDVARQYRRAGLAVPDIVQSARATLSRTSSAALEEIADAANAELAKELQYANKTTSQAVRDAIDSAMALKQASNLTVREAQRNLVELLQQQGIPAIRKNNSQYIQLDHYADTVINAESNKAANLGVLDYAHGIGARYVLMSSHYNSCPLCAPYQNRVFSLDPNDTKYPYLYDTPWSEVYNNFHPNCWHTLSVWIEEAHTPEEVARMQEFSNRSFDVGGEGWTKEQVEAYERGAKAYAEGQKQNAKLYRDRKRFEEYKAVLGDNFKYNSLSGFINGKELDTKQYRETYAAFRDAKKAFTSGGNGDIISANTGEQTLRIPRFAASRITKKINDGEYSTKLSHQQYLKHVEGTLEYNREMARRVSQGRNLHSVLTISEDEAQAIISQKAGTGIIRSDRNGNPQNIERITCDGVIGGYYHNGEYLPTNKASIYYGKRSSHLVPIRGENYD